MVEQRKKKREVEVYDACSGMFLGKVESFEELCQEIVGREKWIPRAKMAEWNAIEISSAKNVRSEEAFSMATTLHLVAHSQSGAII